MKQETVTISTAKASIVMRGLTRRFGEITAVAPIDIEIGAGSITGLLGPNGSGKSTLMRMLIGLVRPSAGSAVVAGERLRGDGTRVRRRVSYAPGEIGVFGEMRGREHLRWLLRGRDKGAFERGLQLADRLELPLKRRVRTYSHGMKRQLLFAAALAPQSAVRILDEPTEGLDPSKRGQVLDILSEDAARGACVLLSSHHLLEVDRACERLIFLNRGVVVADEVAAALRSRAKSLVKLSFGTELDFERVESILTGLDCGSVHRTCEVFGLVLHQRDPRSFLAALAASDLPAPATISYGTPSLQDLYRDLYGVEGV